MKRQKYFKSHSKYWSNAESVRAVTGSLPDWVFDFIGIHSSAMGTKYSLSSPLCLATDRTRPYFERVLYDTERDAINAAKKIASEAPVKVHVVHCVAKMINGCHTYLS